MRRMMKGFSFPFGISEDTGGVKVAEETAVIESCLRMLLVTERGSRPFRRNYGIGMSLLLQEPNDDILKSLIMRLIVEGITVYEPRVLLNSVDIRSDDTNLFVTIVYETQTSGEERTAQFLFAR